MDIAQTAQPLTQKKCVACEGFETPLNRTEAEALMQQLQGWTLSDDAKSISKSITFKDFAGALAMADKCGAIFEEEGHHPDLLVAWGKLTITTWTHAINGLSENDFIVAAKIDELESANR
jgi:4a-hydroxytetrahydrobiopterin dehydratase